MRSWAALVLAFCAALAAAQTEQNAIVIPAGESTLQVAVGQPLTINWQNPSAGTVTIKLQQGSDITPDSGIVVASGIPASQTSATFPIPSDVDTADYTIEIIDDTNQSNYNFSPQFAISGATALSAPTATGSASSGSASASATGSSSNSASVTSASASSASSAAASSTSSNNSNSSSSSSPSQTASASPSSQTTTAPSSNSGMSMKAQGGLMAAVLGGIALL